MNNNQFKKYHIINEDKISAGPLTLRAVQNEDIEKIRIWRNNQREVLRQNNLITENMQKEYYQNIIWPQLDIQKPKEILLSILNGKNLIGYGGLVNIEWEYKRAEISFLLDNNLVDNIKIYCKTFEDFLEKIKEIAFEDLKLNRLYTETYCTRSLHISILEKKGFKKEGVMKSHVKIKNNYFDSIIHGCLENYQKRNEI